jgi:hypothetical protein
MPTNGAILNFDLSDLQKNVKSKTWVLCHVSLLDKIFKTIQPLVQELYSTFCVFWF